MSDATALPTELDLLYGAGASQLVFAARILVVGAGGVGCELVKNLAFSGFKSITLIDLDTIDVSNLNRQFLFRREHVAQPKATVAATAIRALSPHVNIEGLVGNIKERRFDVAFFKSFTLVCNALDNLDARRHVNRMCLAAGVPLIESGSTGYNGQVSVIAKDVECYDCTEKPPQKSYAVCTIRSTPEKPVHCVVWAKFLWNLIFGPNDEGNVLSDLDGGGGVPSEEAAVTDENAPLQNGIVENVNDVAQTAPKKPAKRVRYSPGEPASQFAKRVCQRVYVDDIEDQVRMKNLWTERAPPIPYDLTADENVNPSDVNLADVDLLEQRVWTKTKSAAIFKRVLEDVVENRRKIIGNMPFDKDDRHALAFVVAASNLRGAAYGVPLQSPFAVKGIAGNIVHAIATTNAMVGGLVVLEALKLTVNKGSVKDSLTTFVSRNPTGNRVRKVLCPERLQKPNKRCFVCSQGQLVLSIDTEKSTLRMLVENVLRKKLSVLEPGVFVTSGDFENTLYECGQGLEEDEVEMYAENMDKTLAELKVENGSRLTIDDLQQELKCVLHVAHASNLLEDHAPNERFVLEGHSPTPAAKANGRVTEDKNTGTPVQTDGLIDVDEVELVEPVGEIKAAATKPSEEDTANVKGEVQSKKPMEAKKAWSTVNLDAATEPSSVLDSVPDLNSSEKMDVIENVAKCNVDATSSEANLAPASDSNVATALSLKRKTADGEEDDSAEASNAKRLRA